MIRMKYSLLGLAVASLLGLSACSHDDDDDEMPVVVEPDPVVYRYEVTITNLTHAQPVSPVAVALHGNDMQWWAIGEAASNALATLAEGGDNSAILDDSMLYATNSGSEPLPPGDSITLELMVEDMDSSALSVATMLVNTNDAFSGVTGVSLSALEVGAQWQHYSHVYDAGTEANTEAMGTIPGPADGGEGSSAGREPHDFVTMHPGVVSADDGLMASVLSAAHKFDNPALRISVTRLE